MSSFLMSGLDGGPSLDLGFGRRPCGGGFSRTIGTCLVSAIRPEKLHMHCKSVTGHANGLNIFSIGMVKEAIPPFCTHILRSPHVVIQ